jgi:Tfp pilus assembly protein PilO
LKITLKKEQMMVYGAVAAVIVICVIVIARFVPLRKKINELSQERTGQKFIIQKAAAESANLAEMKEHLKRLEQQTASYDKQLPNDRDLGTFLQQIADLMDEHKLTEQQVEPGKKLDDGKLSCIPIEMTCKGKLQQIFDFQKALGRLDRLIRIESIELVNDTNLKGQVKMTAKTRIYYKAFGEKG